MKRDDLKRSMRSHHEMFANVKYPMPKGLSFIHKLQTEMSSQMNAFKQRLDAKPAHPQGFPERRDHHHDGPNSRPCARQLSRKPRSSSQWTTERSALQQWRATRHPGLASAGRSGSRRARSRRCSKRTGSFDKKPEPPDQAVGMLHLASFETASSFETLVIILHDPAVFIPPNALPGLVKRRGGNRG